MFGYVVVDDDKNVVKIIPEDEFYTYMTVSNIEDYKVGDKYPLVDLDDYQIAEVKFINGVNNDKSYYFRDYDDTLPNTTVVVDTVYGMQIARVVSTHSKEGWHGIQPTKDIVGEVWYENYAERQEKRNQIIVENIRRQHEEERRKKEEAEKKKILNMSKSVDEKNTRDNVRVFEFDEKNIDDFYKIVRKILGDFIDD